jgi:hypothetical protein
MFIAEFSLASTLALETALPPACYKAAELREPCPEFQYWLATGLGAILPRNGPNKEGNREGGSRKGLLR